LSKGSVDSAELHSFPTRRSSDLASFDVLAPQLENVHLIALDCAGHGFSGHRSSYNIWEDVGELFAVADLLGWNEFALLGHSRGADRKSTRLNASHVKKSYAAFRL